MKKKIGLCVFLVAGLLLCVLPFVGMSVAPTTETTEKKELAKLPDVKKEGSWNLDFLSELGTYFEDHFAGRQYLVSVDSWIESLFFQKTNIDNVIVGKHGWLFYKDSLNDYQGKEILSDRSIYNIAYNMKVMQNKVEAEGHKFVFTIAPNKNSLYGEHMPYTYSFQYSDVNNRRLLEKELEKQSVNYADLYGLFSGEQETLYLKKDSHWNNKGALLAYNALCDKAGWEHEDYRNCEYEIKKDYVGDLNSMVYPLLEQPEENYHYHMDTKYQYVNKGNYEKVEESTVSVEDAIVQTSNKDGKGSLVMYRDSFGNTLLPFMANAFEDGYFFKTTPYNTELHMKQYNPDVVIVEKVERKLDELAYFSPALMSGVEVTLPESYRTIQSDTSLFAVVPETNTSFYEIYGILEEDLAEDAQEIYVEVGTKDGGRVTYQAFCRSIEEVSDYGYVAYIPNEMVAEKKQKIRVYLKLGEDIFCVKEEELDISGVKAGEDIPEQIQPDTKKKGTKQKQIIVLEKGEMKTISTSADTLQEMMDSGEIEINKKDRVIPDLEDTLFDREVVSIQRVVVKEKKVVKKIPFQKKEVVSDELYKGESKVTTKGKKGEKTIIYRLTYVDGKLEKKEKVSQKVTKKPVDEVTSVGNKEKPIPTTPPPQPARQSTPATKKPSGRTIVSKEWVEDCGTDSGYWIITYSDGTVEYVDG